MSGHSHWHSIKYKKGMADAKKSKVFSKIVRLISVAAKEGGGNPESNSKLRLAIEKAKSVNLPAENIDRAIKKGVGGLEEARLEPLTLEAFGPGNVALLIEGITDNKNRALTEIKQILNQNQGKLVGEGSVKWLFEKKGVITINSQFLLTAGQLPTVRTQQEAKRPVLISNSQFKNKEELEMKVIEAGADDVYWHNETLDIYTKIGDLEKVKRELETQGIKIESASLDWVAKENIEVSEKDKAACQKLFEDLDESETVQEIYSNLKD